MRILIVDQCSSKKRGTDRHDPLDLETIDTESRDQLVERSGVPTYRARELYEGRQQQRISEATNMLVSAGDEVDRIFLSAGFGVVDEDESLPLYDATFADMNSSEIDSRSADLRIHEDLRTQMSNGDYDIIFFALGRDYYRSARLDDLLPHISDETFVVFFNREELEQEYDNGLSLAARTTQAKHYGTIVIALKGEYLLNFATHRKAGSQVVDVDDIEAFCKEPVSTQSGFQNYESSNRS